MPPARAEDGDVLARLLAESKIGRFTVPISNLQHTSIGRPLHTKGINTILESIKTQGWLGSKMTVCLVGSIPDGGLTDDAAAGQQYRLINGNHRLAALRRLEEENKAADPPIISTDAIEVEVHAGLTLEKERLVAASLNVATELVVKTTLSDRVVWYKSWHDDLQGKHKGKTRLSANAVSSKFIQESKKAGVVTQSAPTVKKFMKIVQAMKPRALDALHDVTHLPGRHAGHHDVGTKNVPFKLLHSRVTAVSLERQQFAELTGTEQEAYVYRLASVDEFPGVVTADNYLTLDQTAKDVARMVDTTEKHLGPVSEWTEDFKKLVAKSRNYEGSAKFVTHFNSRVTAAETYKRKLPEGMAADGDYMEWIKSQPWSPLVMHIKGSAETPHEMKHIYDTYIKSKEDKLADAIAAEGLFKTQLAEKVKIATDAAAAAKAANDAAALEESTAAAAKSAKEAAAVSKVTAAEAIVKPAAAASTAEPDVEPAAADSGKSSASTAVLVSSSATTTSGAGAPARPAVRLAENKRKAERDDATKELRKKARLAMSKLLELDILSPDFEELTDVHHPEGKPIMLAFLNVAANRDVLNGDNLTTLKKALTFLSNALSERGTLVVALPDLEFNRTTLKALFKAAGLILEDHAVVSLFLHGKSGRPARADRFVYPCQSSVTLLAHKSDTFICNGGGPRSGPESSSRSSLRGASVAPPRTMELDRIAAVVSYAHPPTGTFLAESTADMLIKRFSDVGDSILVSGGLKDGSLASKAMHQGRVMVVLEPDSSKLAATAASLDELSSSAARDGMWARMLKVSQPLVTVGPKQLPSLVPASNVPASTLADLETFRDGGSEDPERAVAERTAASHGLQIKGVGAACGLFADKRLEDTPGVFLKMPLVGSFEVHDSEDDSLIASKEDGFPRFLVSNTMSMFLSDFEVARPKAGLYLVPGNTSPLFYMKSGVDASKKNSSCNTVLSGRGFRVVDDKEAYLKNATNSVMFDIECTIEKDQEVFAHCNTAVDV